MEKVNEEMIINLCGRFRDKVSKISTDGYNINMTFPFDYGSKVKFSIMPAKNNNIYISDNGEITRLGELTLRQLKAMRMCSPLKLDVQGFDDISRQVICYIYAIVKPYDFLYAMGRFEYAISVAQHFMNYRADDKWRTRIKKQKESEYKRWKEGKIKATERIWGLDY